MTMHLPSLARAFGAHHRASRAVLSTLLAVLLAVGLVVVVPVAAQAATESRVPLPSGVSVDFTMSSAYAAFGSTIVVGNRLSRDAGATWTSTPAVSDSEVMTRAWFVGGEGTLVGLVSLPGGISLLRIWTPTTGELRDYDAANAPTIITYNSKTYITQNPGAPATYTAHDLASRVAGGWVDPGSTPGITPNSPVLTPSGAVLWSAYQAGRTWWTTEASTDVFGALPWITNAAAVVGTLNGLQYAVADVHGLSLCTRQYLSGATTCVAGPTGDMTNKTITLSNFGASTIVSLSKVGRLYSGNYVWTGSTVSAMPSLDVELPDSPTRVYGDVPYLVFRTPDGVPTIQRVAPNGTLGQGLALPPIAPVAPYLAVGPDRVLGTDDRDGSTISTPSWTRSTTGSSLGTESLDSLKRVAKPLTDWPALLVSAGRSVMEYNNPEGSFMVRNLDRGQEGALSSGIVKALSGPYLLWYDGSIGGDATRVTTVTNTTLANPTNGQLLFGSQVLTADKDALATGIMRINVTDLTGVSPTRVFPLAVGTAACSLLQTWGDTVSLGCGGSVQIYNYRTGALLGSHQGVATSLGDGYAILTVGVANHILWALASDTVTALSCAELPADDGVGHLACWDSHDLIWNNYSELSTSPARLLGGLGVSTFDVAGQGHKLEIDTTKPLNSGSLVIRSSGGSVVRTIPTPASTDGSLRVTWDGKDATGTPLPPGTYSAELVASATDGSGEVKAVDGAPAPRFQFTRRSPGTFVSLAPSRLLDSRTGNGYTGKVPANAVVGLQVSGRGGVPAAGVAAVVLNTTVTDTTATGYITAYPSDAPRPLASNLNFTAGQTAPNLVTVGLGTDGKVNLYNGSAGPLNLIADVAGYYLAGTPDVPGAFVSLTPSRLLDSRTGNGYTGKVPANTDVGLQVAGRGGVPTTGVAAVVLNTTVTDTTATGYITAYPADVPRPLASNLNFTAGQTSPNLVTVGISADGKVNLYNGSAGPLSLIADVAGYYLAGTPDVPGAFVSMAPSRLLDTRTDNGYSLKVSAGAVVGLQVAGRGGVPTTGVAAVILNTTVTDTTATGYITAYPSDVPRPLASNLNFTAGQTTPNLVTVGISTEGRVNLYNGSAGPLHLIADMAGYYLA